MSYPTVALYPGDIIIKPGATFTTNWTWLSPSTGLVDPRAALVTAARCMFREYPWDVSPLVSLTLNSGVTVNGSSGLVTLTLTQTQSKLLVVGFFDLFLDISDGTSVPFTEGHVYIDPSAVQ